MATIVHADMDAFYASVEQLDRPELRGQPIIVGSPSARGVVLTASYEARPFGVRSAMPALQARELCPDCLFVAPRMQRYAEIARHIRAVFEQFTPLVEPISLDEAFLDISASLKLFGGARALAAELKLRVHQRTGLTVSVGIGPTKMIAKIASDLRKPDGLVEVLPQDAVAFLRPLPVGRLWGVGPATLARLERLGIRTIGDIAAASLARLENAVGSSAALLQALARGEDGRDVAPDRPRKSYGEENTFTRDLRDGPQLRTVIRSHAEAVARRLRSDRRLARVVVLKLKLTTRIAPGKYPILTRRQTLPTATDDGPTIAAAALDMWQAVHGGRPVRLIGVAASDIVGGESGGQLGLFADRTRARQSALNRALDDVRSRFGDGVIRRGEGGRKR